MGRYSCCARGLPIGPDPAHLLPPAPALNRMRKSPLRVYPKHGALWFVDLERRWHKLCRIDAGEAAMYEALAKLHQELPLSRIPAAIAKFKLDYLPGLAVTTQKEHARLLDVPADEFEQFAVADVQPSDVARSVTNAYRAHVPAATHPP